MLFFDSMLRLKMVFLLKILTFRSLSSTGNLKAIFTNYYMKSSGHNFKSMTEKLDLFFNSVTLDCFYV
jgi:hypothetical protein